MSDRKVLFLGNGIVRDDLGKSWEIIIKEMAQKYNERCVLAKKGKSKLPLPLQAVVATNNNIDDYMKKENSDFYGHLENPEKKKMIRKLLSAGFDDIITTNYSYEIEIASTEKDEINNSRLDKMRRVSTKKLKKAEGKHFIYTYNLVSYKGKDNRVWHIHGVSKNPSSMVIGHYYYGNLVGKYKEFFDKRKNHYQYDQDINESWLDSFILGDVYVLGCGFDPSEFDLWWLAERKNQEKEEHGRIYYYAPKWERRKNKEKYELMECYNIQIMDSINNKDKDYNDFYKKAVNEIIKAKKTKR